MVIRPPRSGTRRVLRQEPYDPDARDADGDQIVQEYTIWERPGGTFITDAAGNLLGRGVSASEKPSGFRVVDRNKKKVPGTPKPEAGPTTGGGLGPSLGPSLAETGALSLADSGLPNVSGVTKPPTKSPAPSVPQTPSVDVPSVPPLAEPKKPYSVPPPPLSGKAAELADQSNGDWNQFLTSLDKEGYVVFDYETTGFDNGDVPVQVGAVKVKNGEIVDRLNVYMNPERPLAGWSLTNLKDPQGNVLTDEFLKQQPSIKEAHQKLSDFLAGGIVVAHNLPYDQTVLEQTANGHGVDLPFSGSIDTLELARQIIPKSENGPTSHGLGSLAEFLGIKLDNAHTADADAEATGEVLRATLKRAITERVDHQILSSEHQRQLQIQKNEKYAAEMAAYLVAKGEYDRQIAQGG